LQHIDYDAQVEFKRQALIDRLTRTGVLERGVGRHPALVQEAIAAAEPWGYRNQARFHLTPEGALGFLSADRRRVVPVKDCLVLDPLLDDLWAALDVEWPGLQRLTLRCGSATGDQIAVFELDHYEDFEIEVDFAVSCVILLADGEAVVLMGNPYYLEHVAGRDYRISAGSAFPENTAGAEALVSVLEEVLEPTGRETLLSLDCGVGLYSLALASRVRRLFALEADPRAAADFRYNAQDLDHVTLLEGNAPAALPDLAGPVDLALLEPDPPGAGRATLVEVARLAPSRLAYLSSDPAALARDAHLLGELGYRLHAVHPLDLAPQAHPIAALAHFVWS
jgi:23S rRNA (uracil1939-C5)-methyltransferase